MWTNNVSRHTYNSNKERMAHIASRVPYCNSSEQKLVGGITRVGSIYPDGERSNKALPNVWYSTPSVALPEMRENVDRPSGRSIVHGSAALRSGLIRR
jgi:hypothetical protein